MGCSSSASVATAPHETSKRRGRRVHPAVDDEPMVAKVATKSNLKAVASCDAESLSTAASVRAGTPPDVQQDMALVAAASRQSHGPVPIWPRKMLVDAPDHPFLVYGVLSYLPWSQRVDMTCLSRGTRKFFNPCDVTGEYWRWHCVCLCNEAHLLLPAVVVRPDSPSFKGEGVADGDRLSMLAGGGNGDFRALFFELWPLRLRFADEQTVAAAGAPPPERCRVSTFCRLRPAAPATLDGAFCEALLSTPVTLPLGQRVALLRQRHPELSRAAAMRMFLNKDCGAADPLDEGDSDADPDGIVTPVAEGGDRIPALSATQSSFMGASVAPAADLAAASCGSGFNASVMSTTTGRNGSVLTVSPGIGIRKWNFAHVFAENTSQRTIFETTGLRLATNLVNGQSGALIVYGQTGSGKTHTMFGPPSGADGLVPRIADEILALLEARRAAGYKVRLGASYVEVFGNDVNNLLGKDIAANRGQAQRMGHRYVLDGKVEENVADRESFASLLQRGEASKRKASTEMNERSTRAHTLVILRLRQRAPWQGPETTVESFLSLVDLGGSERVTKSKAHEKIRAPGAINVGDEEVSRVSWQDYYKSRERITETNHINSGLLALKRCVHALNKRQRCLRDGHPPLRVPFNDSKLTMLLEPALSGEATTSIVVCCSPEDRHAEETVQSLRFGEMCSAVRHEGTEGKKADVSAVVASAIKQIDADLKEVEAAIRAKEKWEWRKTVRVDVIDEKDTGGTVCHHDEEMELGGAGAVEIMADDGSSAKRTVEHEVWSQVLVGAEAENARREELLKTRQRLLGE